MFTGHYLQDTAYRTLPTPGGKFPYPASDSFTSPGRTMGQGKPSAAYVLGETDAPLVKGTRRPIRDPGLGRFSARLKEAMQGKALKPFSTLNVRALRRFR